MVCLPSETKAASYSVGQSFAGHVAFGNIPILIRMQDLRF